MGYRFPTSVPTSLPDMWERLRELVHQLEPVVLRNVAIATTETAVAHGLREVPGWVGWDPPHCIAIVKQTKDPDKDCVYLKATNACVINVYVVRAGPFQPSSGRYDLADLDFEATDDHKVIAQNSDTTTVGGLLEKTLDSATVTRAVVTDGGVQKLQFTGTASYDGYDFVFCVPGLTSAWAILAAWPVLRSVTLPTGLTGSYCKVLGVVPTAAVTITIKLLHSGVLTSVAAAGISGGTADGSFACAAPIVMVAGDFLVFYNQTPADATMTGLTIGLKGARA